MLHSPLGVIIEADQLALKAENKQNFTLLAKSDALRSKAKLMQKNIDKQMCVVKSLLKT